MEENKLEFTSRIDLSDLQRQVTQVRAELKKVIVGQEKMIDYLLVALLSNGHVLLEGVPGIAKTITVKLLSKALNIGFSRIQFTPDLMPSDVLGTSVFDLKKSEFEFKKGPIFSNLVLIDEINRGEISKIFGELFFSIDPGYRGEKGSVSTQYANLHENDEKFYIPENVYIIGTMNDIDRSVDTFDFAMRRRFRFVEITAESQLGMLDDVLGDKAEEAKARLRNLNAEIEKVQELNSHYHIGPSYFLKLEEVDFDYELLWSDYLKPLLEDYLRGSYEEVEILETLKKAFDLISNVQKNQVVTDNNEGDGNEDADH